jgi:hypothetical protein
MVLKEFTYEEVEKVGIGPFCGPSVVESILPA